MHQIVPALFVLRGLPPYAINVYLMGDVLLDAGTRYAGTRILRQLRGRQVHTHALTEVHADHQGVSYDVCQAPASVLLPHALRPLAAAAIGVAPAWLGYALRSERRVHVSQPVPGRGSPQLRPTAAEYVRRRLP
jgi:glyoxylase-like metal-dependent hydrolase (beta-lactamase superfamily II)